MFFSGHHRILNHAQRNLDSICHLLYDAPFISGRRWDFEDIPGSSNQDEWTNDQEIACIPQVFTKEKSSKKKTAKKKQLDTRAELILPDRDLFSILDEEKKFFSSRTSDTDEHVKQCTQAQFKTMSVTTRHQKLKIRALENYKITKRITHDEFLDMLGLCLKRHVPTDPEIAFMDYLLGLYGIDDYCTVAFKTPWTKKFLKSRALEDGEAHIVPDEIEEKINTASEIKSKLKYEEELSRWKQKQTQPLFLESAPNRKATKLRP